MNCGGLIDVDTISLGFLSYYEIFIYVLCYHSI